MKRYLLLLVAIVSTAQTIKADKVLAATFTIDPTKASIGSTYTLALNTVIPEILNLEVDFGDGVKQPFTYSFDGNYLSPKFILSLLKGSTVKLYLDDPLDIGLIVVNAVSDVDISSLTNLRWLGVYNGSMTQLNVSTFPNLTFLAALNLKLESLDLSNNPLLTNLICSNNQLTELDLSSNLVLTDINCEVNKISSLTLPSISLNSLICGNNNLVFSSLPPLSSILGTKDYSPQAKVQLSSSYNIADPIDLSAVGATSTVWGGAPGNTISFSDLNDNHTIVDDVTTFTGPVGEVFASLTNPDYPLLTISTTTINIIDPFTTSIDETRSTTKVEGQVGAIVISTDSPALYSVFSTSGTAIANGIVSKETPISTPQGIYLVTVGESTYKVIVR